MVRIPHDRANVSNVLCLHVKSSSIMFNSLFFPVCIVTDNQFSGTIPERLFQIDSIKTVALSVNCFTGALPLSMCEARQAEVFSMDGLGNLSLLAVNMTVFMCLLIMSRISL